MSARPSSWRFAAALFAAVLFAAPLMLMASVSLTAPGRVAAGGLWPGIEGIRLSNYVEAWRSTNFSRQFFNSVFVALAVTLGQIVTSLLAGYAFARMTFKGRDGLFALCLSTIIVPFQVLVIPVFILLVKLAWVNTYWALVVPSLANAFGIFLFTQFFRTIPKELEEAAHLDGAGPFTVLFRILVPLCGPVVTTLFLFTFIAEWNDLFKPLVFTSTKSMRTVQLGLTVFQEQFKVEYALLMAAVVFVTLPSLVLFFLGQKHFVKGIATSGMK